jgi:hypothetical protein
MRNLWLMKCRVAASKHYPFAWEWVDENHALYSAWVHLCRMDYV